MVAPDRERMRAAMLRREASRAEAYAERTQDPFAIRALLQRQEQRLLRARPVVALPAGEVVLNALGSCWRRTHRHALDELHGTVRLGGGQRLDRDKLAALVKSDQFAGIDSKDCLFLDTETTGLSGGAGTVVFAVGLGWFEDDALVFEQYFLRDFGEEPAMLTAVAERLQQHPVPVSFVGKSFDRHRIAARLAVHRLSAPILTAMHLDLYHLSRRAFGKQLPDCRLRTVEERRLGFHRTDDLPGSEAPMAFLDWIRDQSGPVDRVLEHNRLDVLSVAALLGVLAGA